MTVTAIYQSLARRLLRLKADNMKWRTYPAFLISENRWMAQRNGVEGSLIDFGKEEATPYPELLEELIAWISEDADALGCLQEVKNARRIIQRGTSAARQIVTYENRVADGAVKREALKSVVDQLVEETVRDL